jgi:hypothetical protein
MQCQSEHIDFCILDLRPVMRAGVYFDMIGTRFRANIQLSGQESLSSPCACIVVKKQMLQIKMMRFQNYSKLLLCKILSWHFLYFGTYSLTSLT